MNKTKLIKTMMGYRDFLNAKIIPDNTDIEDINIEFVNNIYNSIDNFEFDVVDCLTEEEKEDLIRIDNRRTLSEIKEKHLEIQEMYQDPRYVCRKEILLVKMELLEWVMGL